VKLEFRKGTPGRLSDCTNQAREAVGEVFREGVSEVSDEPNMMSVTGSAFADRDLPPETPLAMPVQDFYRCPPQSHRAAPPPHWARRGFLVVGSGLIGFGASLGIAALLALDGYDLLDQVLALLSLLLFA